jgi:hypothetical protein
MRSRAKYLPDEIFASKSVGTSFKRSQNRGKGFLY